MLFLYSGGHKYYRRGHIRLTSRHVIYTIKTNLNTLRSGCYCIVIDSNPGILDGEDSVSAAIVLAHIPSRPARGHNTSHTHLDGPDHGISFTCLKFKFYKSPFSGRNPYSGADWIGKLSQSVPDGLRIMMAQPPFWREHGEVRNVRQKLSLNFLSSSRVIPVPSWWNIAQALMCPEHP